MLFTLRLAALALSAAAASAAAIPSLSITDVTKRATDPLPGQVLLNHTSSWFGWQLAGGASSQNQLSQGCQDIDSIGGEKWSQIGLVPALISKPLCNASHSDPNPGEAFPESIPAISAIINHQILGTFTSKKAFEYLCDNLGFLQINEFFLDDQTLLGGVCGKAGKQIPPRPFGAASGHDISDAARYAAENTASIMYATLVAAGAGSDTELNILCAHAPNHIDNLNSEQLNGTLIENRICSSKQPISVEEARSELQSWSTRLFVTILENVGNVGGYNDWLCENVDIEGMNGVGLIGSGSKKQICEDAKNGLPKGMTLPEPITACEE